MKYLRVTNLRINKLDFILIAADPKIGIFAEKFGINVILVDLEIQGKVLRQAGRNTLISRHTLEDVKKMRNVLSETKLLVRINPINENSKFEIDSVITAGADGILLPMFTNVHEVKTFIKIADERVECHLLLETGAALARIKEIVKCPGISSIHIGLNDLSIDLKLDHMFELVFGGIVDYACGEIAKANIKYGFGGVGRIEGHHVIKPEIILREHIRLNSSQVILSRDFKNFIETEIEVNEDLIIKSLNNLKLTINKLANENPN
jgi:hypothetical protein